MLWKVTGDLASVGLQLSTCWQGKQTAQVKEDICFRLSLGPFSIEQNKKSQKSDMHKLQS